MNNNINQISNSFLQRLKFTKIFIVCLLLLFALNLWGCSDLTKKDSANFKKEEKSNFINYKNQAEQGDAKAQYNLAWMYYQGVGITQDYKQAFKWFSKAAEQGNVESQYRLALIYFFGNGMIQDNIMAHMFANIASTNGNENARKFRDKIAQLLTPEQVTEAQKRAKAWMRKHKTNAAM